MAGIAAGTSTALCWHQALTYAITGVRAPELGSQPSPDLAALADWLRSSAGRNELAGPPYVVPEDLMTGIGAAQFWAALTQLRAELRPTTGAPPPVLADRALTADERRLVGDVPPHHGS